jgi:hypothetical protein
MLRTTDFDPTMAMIDIQTVCAHFPEPLLGLDRVFKLRFQSLSLWCSILCVVSMLVPGDNAAAMLQG